MRLPGEFVLARDGVAVRHGFETELEAWLESTARPGAAEREAVAVSGGRGVAHVVALRAGGRAFVRRYVHGGLLGALLRDVYWQRPPRPWRELVATEAARGAGVLAPEVLAAAVLPACGQQAFLYRGLLVTRAIEGRRSLRDALCRAPGAVERAAWIACAVQAIRQLHAAGIHHPDLNVANVLVADRPGTPAALIDFDRASVRARAVGPLRVALARRRLSRSIAKLGLPGLDRAGARRALRAAGLGTAP